MFIRIICSLLILQKKYHVSFSFTQLIQQTSKQSLNAFIDLESEMYQLSHLLSEQKLLLGSLSTSVLGDDTPVVTETDTSKDREEQEEEQRQKIASISERVEGCTVCFTFLNTFMV